MILSPEYLFCPYCKEAGDLWISPRHHYDANCKRCGHVWENNELKEICIKIIHRAEMQRSSEWYAACLRIQMQYMTNPFTGEYLA